MSKELPFPPNLPPLPEPPAGHRLVYHPTGWTNPNGSTFWSCDDGGKWSFHATRLTYGLFRHYAEAVPITEPAKEPDFFSDDYQKGFYAKFRKDPTILREYATAKGGQWNSMTPNTTAFYAEYFYRDPADVPKKKEPKRVKLGAKDICALTWFRMNSKDDCPVLAIQITPLGVGFRAGFVPGVCDGNVFKTYQELLDEGWEHTTGLSFADWKPCWKEEA